MTFQTAGGSAGWRRRPSPWPRRGSSRAQGTSRGQRGHPPDWLALQPPPPPSAHVSPLSASGRAPAGPPSPRALWQLPDTTSPSLRGPCQAGTLCPGWVLLSRPRHPRVCTLVPGLHLLPEPRDTTGRGQRCPSLTTSSWGPRPRPQPPLPITLWTAAG